MTCKKCGTELKDDEKVCPQCGEPVGEQQGKQKAPEKDKGPASAKAKIGLSVGLIAAVAYLCCLSSYAALVLILIGGYVLLAEENVFLRKSVVKALAVAACFLMLGVAVNLVPTFMSFLNDLLGRTGWVEGFSEMTGYRVIVGIFSAIGVLVKIARIVFAVLLGVFAYFGKTIRLPVIDSLIDKNVK